jgi:hypothetical protein
MVPNTEWQWQYWQSGGRLKKRWGKLDVNYKKVEVLRKRDDSMTTSGSGRVAVVPLE